MTGRPTIQQIKEALDRSGYLMEQRLCPLLERRGYYVTPNHEYEDPDSGKSREIDIHALDIVSLYRQTFDDMLSHVLLVACKNNHFPVIAFTHDNVLRGMDVVMSITKAGYPLAVYRGEDSEDEDIEPFLRLGDYHHYYQAQRVASQYCRVMGRKSTGQGQPLQYAADHGDLYDDLDSLIKAVEAEVAEYKEVATRQAEQMPPDTEEDDINLVVIYPVLVLAGDLYECRQTRGDVRLRKANHLVLIRRVKSRAIKGEFFIDLVQESYFDRYLRLIHRERERVAKRLRRYRRLLRRSVVMQFRDSSPLPSA